MAQLLNVCIGLTCVLVIIISNVLSHSTSEATLRFNTMKEPIAQTNKFHLKSVNVFRHGEGGFPCIRIPAITRCGPKGTLHAFAECRTMRGDGCIPNKTTSVPDLVQHLCYKNSTNDGATWNKLTLLAARGCNPTVVCDKRTNNIIVQYDIEFRLNTEYTESDHVPDNNVQISSADDGGHWSVPTLVDLGLYYDIRPGPGTGMQFTATSPWSGRIAFIGYYGYYKFALVYYSDDGGRTYKTSEHVIPYMDESALVQLSDGSLMANMRNEHHNNTCDCRAVAVSKDGGRTFQNTTYDSTLISPVCQGTLLRMHNGSLIFANPASKTNRTTGTVRRSDDDGRTWPYSFPVTNNVTGYAYSSLTEVANSEEVGLLWETESKHCVGPSCRIVFSKIKVL